MDEPIAVAVKILRIDDFDDARKARNQAGVRLLHAHLCIYKIVIRKARLWYWRWLGPKPKVATYYRRYIDADLAHGPIAGLEAWLREHMDDDDNLLIDRVDLA